MGELEQAKDYHQRAIEITKTGLGPNHIEVAASYNNLGLVHQEYYPCWRRMMTSAG